MNETISNQSCFPTSHIQSVSQSWNEVEIGLSDGSISNNDVFVWGNVSSLRGVYLISKSPRHQAIGLACPCSFWMLGLGECGRGQVLQMAELMLTNFPNGLLRISLQTFRRYLSAISESLLLLFPSFNQGNLPGIGLLI
jgi:hypothetical protein